MKAHYFMHPGIAPRQHKGKLDIPTFVIDRVAAFFEVSKEDMMSANRLRKNVEPRHIAMNLIRKYTELPLKDIGTIFGGYNHATIIHAINKVDDRKEVSRQDQKIFDKLNSEVLKYKVEHALLD